MFTFLKDRLRRSEDLLALVRSLRRTARIRNRQSHFDAYLNSAIQPKLQLGSGNNTLPGWLNTDSFSDTHYLDMTEPFPFGDATFKYIFSEHAIEHIHYRQAIDMLSECYRTMQPGATIRLVTPDLSSYRRLFEEPDEPICRETMDELYRDWILPGFYAAKDYIPINKVPSPTFVLNDLFRNYEHKFIFES